MNSEQFDRLFQHKKTEEIREKIVLFVPKPRKSHDFCGLCKDYFLDYLAHIKSQEHISNFQRNPCFAEALARSKPAETAAKTEEKQKDCVISLSNVNLQIMVNVNVEKSRNLKRKSEINISKGCKKARKIIEKQPNFMESIKKSLVNIAEAIFERFSKGFFPSFPRKSLL